MLSASLYILLCGFRNRLRVRLQRLKQPRYLVGAIAGAAYLYFSFFARFRVSRAGAGRRRPSRLPASLTAVFASAPALGGLALMVIALLAWLIPVNSGLLEFSDAELQFLVPAPVSRRQLLLHRLLRSQLGMLFSAVIVGLVSPTAFGFSRLRIAVAAWLLFVTAKLYFTGVTLSRARLGAGSARTRSVAWLPLGVVGVALAVVAGTIGFDWRRTPPGDAMDALLILGGVAHHRLGRVVLLPFMALAQPLFAAWPQPYLFGIAGSVVVMLIVSMWVVLSDGAFQDAVSGIAERRGQEPANKGAGTYKVRSTGWVLAPVGRPETAFAWKAALQTLR
ncbi:MAG: putative ABC exporter domain-containing protein, partial [Vicinamibacterales bacterium]